MLLVRGGTISFCWYYVETILYQHCAAAVLMQPTYTMASWKARAGSICIGSISHAIDLQQEDEAHRYSRRR